MRILHYSLGFPPYRSGGLTKFCIDLIKEQIKEGDDASLLWPGQINLVNKRIKVKQHNPVEGIGSYEIINPLPVPYDEGINNVKPFIMPGDKTVYREFLDKVRPDVIHIHTLMGLHESFLEAAKEKGIKLVFTTHDYFPICPKVTMFRDGKNCESALSCEDCSGCNNTALSGWKIEILQSSLYRALKDTAFIRRMRKNHRDNYFRDRQETTVVRTASKDDFIELRKHYHSMLLKMDLIHYNSLLTRQTYESFFEMPQGVVINITHSEIKDNRKKKSFTPDLIRIRYLGPQNGAKGFFLLRESLDMLWAERKDFRLDVHFTPSEIPEYMCCHPPYKYNDLEGIFDETDVLICPSIWRETFGFTVLEALSFGVPVIISENVGAKDILSVGAGKVTDYFSAETLFRVLKDLKAEDLEEMNRRILDDQSILTMNDCSMVIKERLYNYGQN